MLLFVLIWISKDKKLLEKVAQLFAPNKCKIMRSGTVRMLMSILRVDNVKYLHKIGGVLNHIHRQELLT